MTTILKVAQVRSRQMAESHKRSNHIKLLSSRPIQVYEFKDIAKSQKKCDEIWEKTDKAKLEQRIRVTLNKLAPTNFDKLKIEFYEIIKKARYCHLVSTNFDYEKDLCVTFKSGCYWAEYLAQSIFEKACSDNRYSSMYANLCSYIDPAGEIELAEDSSESFVAYVGQRWDCTDIIDLCWGTFLKPTDDSQGQHAKFKKKILAYVSFIGEL
jgi:hypothetical protein